jgi:tight adherence protein C
MNKDNNLIASRLEKVARQDIKSNESIFEESIFIRVIRPFTDELSKNILKVTPKNIVAILGKKVIAAGYPFKLTVRHWVNLQALMVFCLPILSIFIASYLGVDAASIFLIVLLECSVGLVFPYLILNSKAKERQKQMISALPDVLDLLTVSVEAGLGFDGALVRVIDKMSGPLIEEFAKVMHEIKIGKSKREALRSMAERLEIQDITTFVGSIIQADQLGVSIGNVLRIQSEQMRERRRQRAKEKAMKASVKMLVPMVIFIFPTIFAVLIGPVIIKVMNTFR